MESSGHMGDQRHPKPYVKGVRKQMTPVWKQTVIDRLADNKEKKLEPSDLAALARAIDADKSGIYKTFQLERLDSDPPDWKPQTSSAYVDAICQLLEIDPPLQEISPSDSDLDKELSRIRALPEDQQKRWIEIIRSILPPSD